MTTTYTIRTGSTDPLAGTVVASGNYARTSNGCNSWENLATLNPTAGSTYFIQVDAGRNTGVGPTRTASRSGPASERTTAAGASGRAHRTRSTPTSTSTLVLRSMRWRTWASSPLSAVRERSSSCPRSVRSTAGSRWWSRCSTQAKGLRRSGSRTRMGTTSPLIGKSTALASRTRPGMQRVSQRQRRPRPGWRQPPSAWATAPLRFQVQRPGAKPHDRPARRHR